MIINLNDFGSGGGSYTLPIASSSVLGGVKIGDGINVDSAGTISVSGGSSNVEPATNISSGIITVGDGLAVDENGVVSVGNQVMRFNSEYDEGEDSYSWSEYTKNESSFDIAKITIEDVEVSNTDGFVLINLRYEYQIAFEMEVDADNAYLYFRNDGIEEYEYQTSGDTFKADKIEVYFFTGETITRSPSPYKMAIYIDGNQVFSATDLSWQSKYEDINIFSEPYSEDVYAHIGKITVESMNGDVRTYKPIVTSNGVQFAYYVDGEYDGALDLANNLDGTIIALPKQEKQIGVATTASTGVVKIGSGINVASDGTISVSGGGGGSTPVRPVERRFFIVQVGAANDDEQMPLVVSDDQFGNYFDVWENKDASEIVLYDTMVYTASTELITLIYRYIDDEEGEEEEVTGFTATISGTPQGYSINWYDYDSETGGTVSVNNLNEVLEINGDGMGNYNWLVGKINNGLYINAYNTPVSESYLPQIEVFPEMWEDIPLSKGSYGDNVCFGKAMFRNASEFGETPYWETYKHHFDNVDDSYNE